MRRGWILCGVGLLCLTATDLAAANVPAVSTSRLASRTPDGRFPNAAARNPAVSGDRKVAAHVAYDSAASDIVPGDTNGVSDVFVVNRAGPFDPRAAQATRWEPGSTDLVSTGMGGAPADGPSTLPDVDGDDLHASRCVAFVSAADNLVPGDTNGQPDAVLKNLITGTMTRVSVNSAGQQADGPTFDVQVAGACDRVAFTSSASNLAFTRRRLAKVRIADGKRAPNARSPLMTGQPGAGTRQVYVRILQGQPDDETLAGTTFLASATTRGTPGNADSYDVQMGQLGDACPTACGTTSGDTVAFTSDASNLSPQDGNGVPDVYEHTFRAPTQGYVQRRKGLPHYVKPSTFLVSASE